MTVFGYLILNRIDFNELIYRLLIYTFSRYLFTLVLVSIEKIYETLKTVFDHIHTPQRLSKILRYVSCYQLSSAFGNVVKRDLSCFIYYSAI